MLNRLTTWFFPVDAIANPPAIRMILGKASTPPPRLIVAFITVAILYMAIVLPAGWALLYSNTPPQSSGFGVLVILSITTYFGQLMISGSAFGLGMTFLNTQRLNKTWDMVRVTAGGSRQALRAAWVSILFYRLSGWFGVLVYAPRIVLFGVLLFELMGLRGEHLSYIIGGAQPAVPFIIGLPLLALTLVVAFLMPLSAVGVEIAVGLLFSTFLRSRIALGLLQTSLTFVRALWGFVASFVILVTMTSPSPVYLFQGIGDLWGMSLCVAIGDWGLSLINVTGLETTWREMPNMAYFGVLLIGVIGVQLLIVEGLLRWAANRAQRIE